MRNGCSEVPKTKLPSLLWPAEWKKTAPLNYVTDDRLQMSNLCTCRRADDIHVRDVNVQQSCAMMVNRYDDNKHEREAPKIFTTKLMIFMWKMWACSSRVVAAVAAIDQCETGRKRPLQSHLSHHQHHHHQQHQCHHCQYVDFVMAVNLGVILSQGNDWELNFYQTQVRS